MSMCGSAAMGVPPARAQSRVGERATTTNAQPKTETRIPYSGHHVQALDDRRTLDLSHNSPKERGERRCPS
ncbi:hypothetical protein Sipo8835_44645 [Streptomyces ipomoeae]|uniref:Uncharacterized protein n=1 Tax=Streptomyces ipomoeae TaxID=103232 RepID=A0AAE8VVC5_9ACTN|nr:hypothetical protein Sipo8835_44645 [Streptomyces ipomoeae]